MMFLIILTQLKGNDGDNRPEVKEEGAQKRRKKKKLDEGEG